MRQGRRAPPTLWCVDRPPAAPVRARWRRTVGLCLAQSRVDAHGSATGWLPGYAADGCGQVKHVGAQPWVVGDWLVELPRPAQIDWLRWIHCTAAAHGALRDKHRVSPRSPIRRQLLAQALRFKASPGPAGRNAMPGVRRRRFGRPCGRSSSVAVGSASCSQRLSRRRRRHRCGSCRGFSRPAGVPVRGRIAASRDWHRALARRCRNPPSAHPTRRDPRRAPASARRSAARCLIGGSSAYSADPGSTRHAR
jgi:hypothetical protein